MASAPFKLDFSDLLSEAWERVGIDPSSLSHKHLVSARRSLNLLLIEIEGSDVAEEDYLDQHVFYLNAGQRAFPLPADTVDVLDAISIVGTSEVPLGRVTRQDDLLNANRAATGQPSTYWISKTGLSDPDLHDVQPTGFGSGAFGIGGFGGAGSTSSAGALARDAVYMMFYPLPSTAGTKVVVNRIRQLEKVLNLSDKPDVRRNWYEALCAGLAAKLALKFNEGKAGLLKSEWLEARAVARIESRERASILMYGKSFGRSRRRRA